jgi:hypothetical protein
MSSPPSRSHPACFWLRNSHNPKFYISEKNEMTKSEKNLNENDLKVFHWISDKITGKNQQYKKWVNDWKWDENWSYATIITLHFDSDFIHKLLITNTWFYTNINSFQYGISSKLFFGYW